jgi:hypothetical protein
MELNVPHNYFTAWMVTPSRELMGLIYDDPDLAALTPTRP